MSRTDLDAMFRTLQLMRHAACQTDVTTDIEQMLAEIRFAEGALALVALSTKKEAEHEQD